MDWRSMLELALFVFAVWGWRVAWQQFGRADSAASHIAYLKAHMDNFEDLAHDLEGLGTMENKPARDRAWKRWEERVNDLHRQSKSLSRPIPRRPR